MLKLLAIMHTMTLPSMEAANVRDLQLKAEPMQGNIMLCKQSKLLGLPGLCLLRQGPNPNNPNPNANPNPNPNPNQRRPSRVISAVSSTAGSPNQQCGSAVALADHAPHHARSDSADRLELSGSGHRRAH